MNSNKGFAVSTVLYALLIVFLMFTLVLIASYNASSDILSSATSDLTENNSFTVRQVKPADNVCGENGWNWYKTNTILQVKAPQGTFYWPKDWYNYDSEKGLIGNPIKDDYTYNGLKAECLLDNGKYGSCKGLTLTNITNLLPYDGSVTKRFRRDELNQLYNFLKKAHDYTGDFLEYSYFDSKLNSYLCTVESIATHIITCSADGVTYTHDEFIKMYNPIYQCRNVKNISYSVTSSGTQKYSKGIECTILKPDDMKITYAVDNENNDIKTNVFLYLQDIGGFEDNHGYTNLIMNPQSYNNIVIDESTQSKNNNYFNVYKLSEMLNGMNDFSVKFTNNLTNNKEDKFIFLSDLCDR